MEPHLKMGLVAIKSMRVILKNFRCHTDGTFEFPDRGLIALSGENGSGKSSLLNGICYGLYGKIPGKIKKPYTHGKTTSSVEIEYMGMRIVRHARPKRLMVTYEEVEYEGDAAQNIIHEVLGMNYGEYLATTYVIQRSNSSVLSLSASEQVKFVETLANSTAEKHKEEAKQKIKSINQDLTKVQTEIDLLMAQKEEKEGTYPEAPVIPNEIKTGMNPSKIRTALEKLQNRLVSHQNSLESLRSKLEKARADEKKRADTDALVTKLQTEISQLEEMTLPDTEELEIRKQTLEEEIEEYRSTIEYYRGYLSYLKESDALNRALEDHKQATEQRLEELGPDVVDDDALVEMETRVEEAENQKREYDTLKAKYDLGVARKEEARKTLGEKFRAIKSQGLKGVSTIKTPSKMVECLRANLQEAEQTLKILKRSTKVRMCCPGCSAYVVLSEDGASLERADDTPSKELDEDIIAATEASVSIIKDYIARVEELAVSLNTKIEPLGDAPQDPMVLHKKLLKAKRVREEYDALSSGALPPVIERMKSSLEVTGENYVNESGNEGEITDYLAGIEGELQTKISDRDALTQNISDHASRRIEIDAKTKRLDKFLSSAPESANIKSKELEDQIAKLTQEITSTSLDIQTKRSILDNVSDYEHYQNTLAEISNISKKIDDAEGRKALLERKLEGTYGLEEAEKEAEVLALEETVASINEHAKIYLDQMFQDPILVRLECVKDKGKNGVKLQLNTVIDYKGDTYEDIEELSGGERQRCDIAFLLGVNDMLGSEMLILDECLNEIDASTNTEILILIRDLCGSSKMILVISHEAVRGVFDEEKHISH